MNLFIAICIVVSWSMSMGLNCYQCSSSSAGCNDPFNKSGSGVSETGEDSNNKYCTKRVAHSIITRGGESECSSTAIRLNIGVVCCQKDLCNGARANNQTPIMLVIGLVVILAEIPWI